MEEMERYTEALKALSNPARLRLFKLLRSRGELCVCELVHALSMPQHFISRHLRALRKANLVEVRREGNWMLYSPATPRDDFEQQLAGLVSRGMASPAFRQDAERAATAPRLRKGRCR